jgi:DNA-binding GntR family transcriptional regulator
VSTPWDRNEAGGPGAAYREIKRRIVNLEYRPAEKLSEARLASELPFGRSPIRSALAQLRTEGWVDVSPQSGTFVRALTDRDIGNVTELRVMLEVHCARIAANALGEAEIKALRYAFRTLGPSAAAGDVEAFIDVDSRLHLALYRVAGNDLIAGILLDLRDKVQWIRRACAVSTERVQEGFAELEQIFAALEARDAEAAGARMALHIGNAAAFCRAVDPGTADPAAASLGMTG